MPLDNFDNLRQTIVSQSKRNDVTNSQLADFIAIAETRIYSNDDDPLRIRQLETRATAFTNTTDPFIELPPGFIQQRRFKIKRTNLKDWELVYKTPEQLPFSDTATIPCFFTVTSQVEFDRIPDQAYTIEMQYYKKDNALTEDNQVNIVLTEYPLIYLYGALSELFKFFAKLEDAQYYNGLFIEAISGANNESRRGRYGPAPFMRIEGSTP